jgi:hypothetical protein
MLAEVWTNLLATAAVHNRGWEGKATTAPSPRCTAHGLKKAAATICANMGATDRQMMALFDWKSEKLANVYTAKANKQKLAAEWAKLLGAFFGKPAEVQDAAG